MGLFPGIPDDPFGMDDMLAELVNGTPGSPIRLTPSDGNQNTSGNTGSSVGSSTRSGTLGSSGFSLPDLGGGGLDMSGLELPSMEDMLSVDPVMQTAEWLYEWQQDEEARKWTETADFWRGWESEQWGKAAGYVDQIKGMLPADMTLEDIGAKGLAFASKVASSAREQTGSVVDANLARYGTLADTAASTAGRVGGQLERSGAVEWMATLDQLMPGTSERIKESLTNVFEASKRSSQEAKNFLANYYPGSIAKQQELADLVAGRSKQYLTEGMPADLAKKLERQTLEKLSAQGVATMSQKALSTTAFTKAIRETTFVEKGTALAGAASDLYGKGIGYARSAQALSQDSSTQALAAISAAAGLVPRVDRGALYGAAIGQLGQAGLVAADTAYQLGVSTGIEGGKQAYTIGESDLQKAEQAVGAGLTYGTATNAATTNAMLGQYVARAADRAAQWGLFGQAWGSIFGMIGSILGGRVGGGSGI